MLALSILLVSIWARKWVQLVQIKQQDWRQSNPAARVQSRRCLEALLSSPPGARARSQQSLQWSRREAAKSLVPELLSVISTATFFAVKPGDISSYGMSGAGEGLMLFYAVIAGGIVLQTLLDSAVLWQLVEQFLGFWLVKNTQHAQRILLPILAGTSRRGSLVGYAILAIDIFWMYAVKSATFPLFCSYETAPPQLPTAAHITCWDNHYHWFLVFLSGWGLIGIFTWNLSMVVRKCNWPSNAYWHGFTGLYEKVDEAANGVCGLRLQVREDEDGQNSVVLSLAGKLPQGTLGYLKWLYEPWQPHRHEAKVLLPLEESPPAFHVLLRHAQATADPDPAKKPGTGQKLTDDLLEAGAQSSTTSVLKTELKVEALDAEDGDGRRGLRISPCSTADAAKSELLDRLAGQWRQVAFLKPPHAVEPIPYFLITVLKVAATMAWSAYTRPHVKEGWRVVTVLAMVSCALLIAWISHVSKPSVYACVNTLNVAVLLAASAASLASLALASVAPTGGLLVLGVSSAGRWLGFAAVAVFCALLASVVLRGTRFTEALPEAWWDRADAWLPLWCVNLGEIGRTIDPLSVEEWRDGYRQMTEFLGSEVEPSQILNESLGPVRIVEVWACAGSPRRTWPGAAEPRERLEWVPYERWARDSQNKQGVLSRVFGGSAGGCPGPAEGSYGGKVRVVSESHSWLSLAAMARCLQQVETSNGPEVQRLNLQEKGFRLQDVPEHIPRVLPIGLCGSGKTTLLSALGGLTHSNEAFEIKDGPQRGGVTKDTTAVRLGDERLLIDMPGVGDGGREDVLEFLNVTKRKLAGCPQGACVADPEAQRRLCVNHFLLTVRATETRFSKQREPLKLLSRHLGSMIADPGLLTVVFTDAGHVPFAEQQREIVKAFEEEFACILPRAPKLALATIQADFSQGATPCIFIETPAVLPDRAWKYPIAEQALARRALRLIEARVAASVERQVPTFRWPPVLGEYSGIQLVHEQSQELQDVLTPTFEYPGLPAQDPDWEWSLDRAVGALGIAQTGGLGRLQGSVPECGYHDFHVVAGVRVPPGLFEDPVPIRTELRVHLQIGHTRRALEALLEGLGRTSGSGRVSVPREDLLAFAASGKPDTKEAAAKLSGRLGDRGGLPASQFKQLVEEVAEQVIRERAETNERVNSAMKMVRQQQEEHLKELEEKTRVIREQQEKHDRELNEKKRVIREQQRELEERQRAIEALRKDAEASVRAFAKTFDSVEEIRLHAEKGPGKFNVTSDGNCVVLSKTGNAPGSVSSMLPLSDQRPTCMVITYDVEDQHQTTVGLQAADGGDPYYGSYTFNSCRRKPGGNKDGACENVRFPGGRVPWMEGGQSATLLFQPKEGRLLLLHHQRGEAVAFVGLDASMRMSLHLASWKAGNKLTLRRPTQEEVLAAQDAEDVAAHPL